MTEGREDKAAQAHRLREINKQFKRLAPASHAAMREGYQALELKVEQLEQQLATARQDILREVLIEPSIHPSMKAGCAGEFTIDIQVVCPECWNREWDDDEACEFCNNQSDEHSLVDNTVVVPWDTQKEIFKMMSRFKYQALQESNEQ